MIPILCIAVRKLSGAAGLAAAAAALALIVPGGSSAAQTTAPKPNLTTLVAQAKQLEFQINALSEQYDGLRIQLTRAQGDARIAENAATRVAAALAIGQQAVAQRPQRTDMASGLDPTFQALTAGKPGQFLSQASTIAELDQSSGDRVHTLTSEENQALRDKQTADQQISAVQALEAQMDTRKRAIDAKIDVVNSAAMNRPWRSSRRPGSIPTSPSRPRIRLAARPCRRRSPRKAIPTSGERRDRGNLTALDWSYGHTRRKGSRFRTTRGACGTRACTWRALTWNLETFVFFFADISHVGIYIGDGMMIDAPKDFGETVKVEPVYWSRTTSAVRNWLRAGSRTPRGWRFFR